MEIIKRNVISISCGVVALLIVVCVMLWPMPGWFDSLRQKLETSGARYLALQSLNNETFKKPILDPLNPQVELLGQFPTPKAIDVGIAAVSKLHEQAAAMDKAALEMNEHKPLVPLALPFKRSPQAYSDFKREYHQRLTDFKALMTAVTAPTMEEVGVEADRLWKDDYLKRIQPVFGTQGNAQEVQAAFDQRKLVLPDEMKRELAKNYTVLISDNKTMDTCQGIIPPNELNDPPTDPRAIWAAQLSLWIQEDVVQAIAITNAARDSRATVEKAVVKRVVAWIIPKVYITPKGEVLIMEGAGQADGGAYGAARGQRPGAGFGRPFPGMPGADGEAAAEAEATPGTKVYTLSPTGRVCNSVFDVMHFTVVVDADAVHFREFMANLTRDRFITVLYMDLIGVDREREQERGFMYGPSPVVRLRLTCEAIFLRSWTLKLMPQPVQRMLGIPQPDAAGSPTAGL